MSLHAFFVRIRARRGHQVAAVAVARKLAVLCWHLLTKETDFDHWPQCPSGLAARGGHARRASTLLRRGLNCYRLKRFSACLIA
jgi:hypothetical protein